VLVLNQASQFAFRISGLRELSATPISKVSFREEWVNYGRIGIPVGEFYHLVSLKYCQMNNHYSFDNMKRAVKNPVLIGREVQRLSSWPLHQAYGRYVDRKLGSKSIDVMDADWDNLLILDACRADYFENQNIFDESVCRVISPGKMSWEFMEETFVGEELHDTIYITSNPFAEQLPDNTFFEIKYLIDEWDDEIGTIHPEAVVEAGTKALENHPNKRLILHFMQPHRPYLGPTAERLRERVDLKGYRNEGDGLQIWGAAKEKKVTVEEVRRAYEESLNIVLDVVKDALDKLGGKTVITADHGEMLGERIVPFTSRVWGHSEGFSTPILREVPWMELSTGSRREVTTSSPLKTKEKLDGETVEERLEALGYAE